MTLVKGQDCPTYRAQASEILTSLSLVKSKNDHKNPLELNKPGPPKASSESGSSKVPLGPPQASPPHDPNANCYSQQNLDRIIQMFLQVSAKDGSGSGDKLKAKTPDIYHG